MCSVQELTDRIAELEEDVEALWGLSAGAIDTDRQEAFEAEAREAEVELEQLRCRLGALQAEG